MAQYLVLKKDEKQHIVVGIRIEKSLINREKACKIKEKG